MIEYLPIVLTGIGIIVSILYYTGALRNANKTQQHQLETRQAQLFMQLFDRWTDPAFAKIYGDYRYKICAKVDNNPDEISKIAIESLFESYNPEVWIPIQTLAQYFEGISILVQKKLLDIDTVERLLSGRLIWYWDSTETFIKRVRERIHDPTMYKDLEILANEMKKRKAQPQSKS
jgi:hypothetical protein